MFVVVNMCSPELVSVMRSVKGVRESELDPGLATYCGAAGGFLVGACHLRWGRCDH